MPIGGLQAAGFDINAEAINLPILLTNRAGTITDFNSSMKQFFDGISANVEGLSLNKLPGLSKDGQALVDEAVRDTLAGQPSRSFDLIFPTQSGSISVLLSLSSRRDENGKIVGVVGVGHETVEKAELTRVANDLQLLIDTANAPIFGIDTNGFVNEWNRKAAAITGFSREEVMGKDLVSRFITPEYQDSVGEVLHKALQGEETANFEFPLFTKSNERVDILLNAATRRGTDEVVVGVVGVGQDITELNREKAELTRIANDLTRLIDYANAPIFGVDQTGRVNEWNRKAVEITGFEKADVLGRVLAEDFITPEFRDSVKQVLDNALEGKGTDNFEFPLFSQSGKKVEVLLNATTRVDANGHPIGVIGVGQDITERKDAEEEVIRLASDLQRLIDSANAPILGVDQAGRVSEWNSNLSTITGYSKQEVLGLRLEECRFVDEANSASVAEVFGEALLGTDCQNFEFSVIAKDGGRVELLLNAASRRNVAGEIVGVVGVGQNITERKYIERAQLDAAKMRASNDAKGNFLAAMSHEMRTPLNGVLGMLQLAMGHQLPELARQNVSNAVMSAEHLLNLVNDILDVSKIEAGKIELENKPFKVGRILAGALDIVNPQARSKGLALNMSLCPDFPIYVRGDQQRLRQVLLNLLYNAVKFTIKGGITLSVDKLVEEADDAEMAGYHFISISVADTGIGIEEAAQVKLFGMFTKIQDNRVRNPLGVGLGLAICKQLVELMGGNISVSSKYGEGSTFTFTLKLEKVDNTDEVVEEAEQVCEDFSFSAADETEACMPANAADVLVVEDNEFNMEVVTTMLQQLGHNVTMAWNGSECLEMLFDANGNAVPAQKTRALSPPRNRLLYDVIFMDCNMPIMDGYEASKYIRKAEKRLKLAPVPIIALTAYAMAGDRDKCLEHGMTDYITKPMSKATLSRVIAKHLLHDGGTPSVSGSDAAGGARRVGSSVAPARAVPSSSQPRGGPSDAAAPPSSSSANGLPTLDVPLAVSQLGGDEELFRTLLTQFVEVTRPVADGLANITASADIDMKRLSTVAHTLRGSAAYVGACRLSSAASELEKRAEEGKAGADAGASCRSLVREVCDAFKAVERHELLHKEAGAGAGGAAASWREAAVGAKPPARPEEWSGRASPGGSGGAHAAPSRLAAAGGVEGGSTRTGELEQVVSMLLSAKRQTLDEARLVAAEPHNQERLRSLARAAELYHTASLSAAIGADLLIANARHLRHILRAVRDEPRTGRRVEAAAVEEAALTAMAALRSDVSVELPKVSEASNLLDGVSEPELASAIDNKLIPRMRSLLSDIEEAIADYNMGMLQTKAHTLKTMALYIGAVKLGRSAQGLQEASSIGHTGSLRRLLQELRSECGAVDEWISRTFAMRTLQPATVHVARLIHKKIELCIADIISACGNSDLAAIEEEALHLKQLALSHGHHFDLLAIAACRLQHAARSSCDTGAGALLGHVNAVAAAIEHLRVESHASEKKRLTSWAAWQQAKSGLQSFFSLMIREDVAHDGGDQVLSQLPALDDQKGLRNVGDHAATLQELRESFLLLLPLWAKATQDAARLSNMLAIAGEAYVLHTLAELVGAPRLAHIALRLRTASTIYAPSYAPTTVSVLVPLALREVKVCLAYVLQRCLPRASRVPSLARLSSLSSNERASPAAGPEPLAAEAARRRSTGAAPSPDCGLASSPACSPARELAACRGPAAWAASCEHGDGAGALDAAPRMRMAVRMPVTSLRFVIAAANDLLRAVEPAASGDAGAAELTMAYEQAAVAIGMAQRMLGDGEGRL